MAGQERKSRERGKWERKIQSGYHVDAEQEEKYDRMKEKNNADRRGRGKAESNKDGRSFQLCEGITDKDYTGPRMSSEGFEGKDLMPWKGQTARRLRYNNEPTDRLSERRATEGGGEA